jgi:hypothetical protein
VFFVRFAVYDRYQRRNQGGWVHPHELIGLPVVVPLLSSPSHVIDIFLLEPTESFDPFTKLSEFEENRERFNAKNDIDNANRESFIPKEIVAAYY